MMVRKDIIAIAIATLLLLKHIPSYAQQEKEEPATSAILHNEGAVAATFKIRIVKPASYEVLTRVDWSTDLKKNQTSYKYIDLYAEDDNDGPLMLKYSIQWFEKPEGANATLDLLTFKENRTLWVDLNLTSTILKPGEHTKDFPHEGFPSAVRLTLSTALKAGRLSFDVIVYGYITPFQATPKQNETISPNQTQKFPAPASDIWSTFSFLASSIVTTITPWALPLAVASAATMVISVLALRKRKRGYLLKKIPKAE
jgi:hypothetical protein